MPRKPTIITTRRVVPAKIAYVVLFLAVTGLLVWVMKPSPSAPPPSAAKTAPATRTVADAWQWNKFSPAQKVDAEKAGARKVAPLFSVAGVHEALRQVQLTEQGDVVVDASTLSLLQSAFDSLDKPGTTEQLEELQRIIRTGLPGPAGEQAAKIVHDYHQYYVALRQLEAASARPDNVKAASEHYEQLVALRQHYFGYDTAEKLFAEEQARARYMMASMQIQMSPNLTDEQKQRMQEELRARMPAPKPGPDWDRRYALFAQQKQAVLNAGLTEADKQAQIERLLREHFQEHEIEAARSYQPGQDS